MGGRSTNDAKARIRKRVWDHLESARIARFPFPPHGRIPNFAGAREAAERLFEWPPLAGARVIKVNPDAPQRPLRLEALRRGITVLVPTPRLRAGFMRLDPARIAPEDYTGAVSLSRMTRFAETLSLDSIPTPDCLVVGSVAVSSAGARCGKGEGYADLEYGILRSLGHPPMLVASTVHDAQVVDDIPRDPTDLSISVIATPTRLTLVADPPPGPPGIDWSRLSEEDLAEMPVLAELRERYR
jgi:5-formyltetrahydrofolate cyclo-ligase